MKRKMIVLSILGVSLLSSCNSIVNSPVKLGNKVDSVIVTKNNTNDSFTFTNESKYEEIKDFISNITLTGGKNYDFQASGKNLTDNKKFEFKQNFTNEILKLDSNSISYTEKKYDFKYDGKEFNHRYFSYYDVNNIDNDFAKYYEGNYMLFGGLYKGSISSKNSIYKEKNEISESKLQEMYDLENKSITSTDILYASSYGYTISFPLYETNPELTSYSIETYENYVVLNYKNTIGILWDPRDDTMLKRTNYVIGLNEFINSSVQSKDNYAEITYYINTKTGNIDYLSGKQKGFAVFSPQNNKKVEYEFKYNRVEIEDAKSKIETQLTDFENVLSANFKVS